jgi:hypothetical protein
LRLYRDEGLDAGAAHTARMLLDIEDRAHRIAPLLEHRPGHATFISR